MNWIHLGLVLAALAGTSGAVGVAAQSPVATVTPLTLPVKTRHTGFDCVIPYGDRWISCSRFRHLEAKA